MLKQSFRGKFLICTRAAGGRLASLGFCFVFAVLSLFPKVACSACGDHLHHGDLTSGLESNVLGGQHYQSSLPSPVPFGACHSGKCGSPAPASAPSRDKVQVEDRNNVTATCSTEVNSEVGWASHHAMTALETAQVFLEVAEPPPRIG